MEGVQYAGGFMNDASNSCSPIYLEKFISKSKVVLKLIILRNMYLSRLHLHKHCLIYIPKTYLTLNYFKIKKLMV
jgi:hypothetical protein